MRWLISKLDGINEWLGEDTTIWALFVISAIGFPISYIVLMKW